MMHFRALLLIIVSIVLINGRILPRKSHVKCSKNSQNLWPDYSDKKFYFECISDVDFVKRPCPAKTVFNYYSQKCTWPEDWVKPPEFDSLQSDNLPSCLESELHLTWPDPEHSQDYFRCIGVGKHEKLSCPSGNTFVFLVQMCVAEQLSAITYNQTERFPNCELNELHLRWPDPWHPKNYFICTGIGKFEIRQCRKVKVFDFMKQMCVKTEEFVTSGTTLTTPAALLTTSIESTSTTVYKLDETTNGLETLPTEISTQTFSKVKCLICWRPTCEANELHLKWPDYDLPTNYYQCLSEGVLILKSCKAATIFDFSKQNCVG